MRHTSARHSNVTPGGPSGQWHDGGKPAAPAESFSELGERFNDATTRLVGGIDPSNKSAVLADLKAVQSGLEKLIDSNPDQFQGISAIHAQSIVDQINLEIDAIKSIGKDPFAAKYINDVQRDLIDIVQGDEDLAALARVGGNDGFAAVPDLLAPPAPFRGDAEQTDFMRQFAADAVDLAERAVQVAESGASGRSTEVAQMVGEVKAFVAEANSFTVAQGGLYSARFDNEFADDGVNGTAARALIHGLQTGNAEEVRAAAEVLAANAEDVAGNMLGIGDDPVVPNNGIPDEIDSLAVAGTVFNDATSQLIGGVYQGNQAAVTADLVAAQKAIQQLIDSGADQLEGTTRIHAKEIVDHLGLEIDAVAAAGAAANRFAATAINEVHSDIIDIVQSDSQLRSLANADGLSGFMNLPDTVAPPAAFQANRAQSAFAKEFGNDAEALGQAALDAVRSSDAAATTEVVDRILAFAADADAFVDRQGGLYEARFSDELALEGSNGTAARALIAGLEAGDEAAVQAAEQVLLENVADFAAEQSTTRGGGGTGGGTGWSNCGRWEAITPSQAPQDDAALQQVALVNDVPLG